MVWFKANGIPFWLVGECTHFRTDFSGWIESDVHQDQRALPMPSAPRGFGSALARSFARSCRCSGWSSVAARASERLGVVTVAYLGGSQPSGSLAFYLLSV